MRSDKIDAYVEKMFAVVFTLIIVLMMWAVGMLAYLTFTGQLVDDIKHDINSVHNHIHEDLTEESP